MGKISWKSQDDIFIKKKLEKINELSNACREIIMGRFRATFGDVEYLFSNDLEAQTNFEKADRAFEKERLTEVPWTAYDLDGNVVRLLLTPETFEPIYISHLAHIQNNISKFRDFLMPLVEASETEEELESITW